MTYRAKPINPAYPQPQAMQGTVLGTFAVPLVASNSPIGIAYATAVPCRVEVTNLSGDDVFLGFEKGHVMPPGNQMYTLPGNATRVFIFSRGQKMYAATEDEGVSVTVQVSELSEGGFPFEG